MSTIFCLHFPIIPMVLAIRALIPLFFPIHCTKPGRAAAGFAAKRNFLLFIQEPESFPKPSLLPSVNAVVSIPLPRL